MPRMARYTATSINMRQIQRMREGDSTLVITAPKAAIGTINCVITGIIPPIQPVTAIDSMVSIRKTISSGI